MEDEGQNNFDNVLAGDDEDGAVDDPANQQLVSKQYELKKQKEQQLRTQLMRGVQLSIERMVQSEIDTISTKVLMSHIEPLDRMNYVVIHANKKAIFTLNKRDDTFGKIKANIADYFGLPASKIFLRNQKGEILLSK